MTEEAWDALEAYVRWMANQLGLKDWTIKIRKQLLDTNEVHARVEPIEGRKLATIFFGADHPTEPAEAVKNTIIHELIHLSHRDMTDVIRCTMNQRILGQQAWDILWEAFRVATEIHVDSMATAFATQIHDDRLLNKYMKALKRQTRKQTPSLTIEERQPS